LPSLVPTAGSLSASACEAVGEVAGVPESDGGLRILLAEDNLYNRAVMEDLLPRRGHTLRVAADGRAALAALEHNRFDVMLLDIHMPELDGFQVAAIQRRRELGTGAHLPIIALTARSAEGERERCLQAGMDNYLAKPVRAAELFAAINRVACGRGVVCPVEVGAGVPDKLLDAAALLAACDGDAELLRKMCGHLQTFVPGRLADVTCALQDRDIPRLRESTHKLGGMVSSFSSACADAPALLGRLANQGRFEEAMHAHARLSDLVARQRPVLDTLSVEQLRREQTNSQQARGSV
jgi:CheY-like chemotaxis protein